MGPSEETLGADVVTRAANDVMREQLEQAVLTLPAIRVDIGAGSKVSEGWITLGLGETHQIHSDVRKLECPDNYADELRAIHVIEHVQFWEVPAMLADWFRALKPGGLLAIECPDLIKCCRNVVNDQADVKNGLRALYGDITGGDEMMVHKFLPTPNMLIDLLREAGFIKAREEQPQFHGRRTHRDLRVSARKAHA